jgi:hypothetical protein
VSAQLALTQVCEAQLALLQSVGFEHDRPSSQGGQAPPQSTAVSLPLVTPSASEAAWHVVAQTLPVQSCPLSHECRRTQNA